MTAVEAATRGRSAASTAVSRALRIGPGVVDAGTASARSLVLSVVAAQSLALAGFGWFSTAVLVQLVATGASKALHADPLVLAHPPTGDRGAWRSATSAAAGAALGSSVALAALVAVVAVLARGWAGGALTPVLLAVAAVLPGVLLLDLLRWAAHATERGWLAVSGGVIWTAVSVPVALAVSWLGEPTAAALVLAAGCGAVPAAAVLAARLGVLPAVVGGRRWYADHRRWCARLTMDWALLQLTAEGAFLLVAALTTAEQIGELRKAQLPLAPVVVLTTGLVVFLQPALSRAAAAGSAASEIARRTHVAAVLVGGVAAAYGLVVALVPGAWMDVVVGGDWDRAAPYVWPLALGFAAGGAAAPLGIGLRVMGRLGAQVRVRLWLAVPVLAGTGAAASLLGALAAAWWVAAATVLVAAVWAVLTLRPVRLPDADESVTAS